MPDNPEDLKAPALQLSPQDRDELIPGLIASLDGEPEDTPEAIAQAWDEEIERRIADLDSGKTESIPFEIVLAELRAKIADQREK
jgi:putative addiction module component (TIGR02574 family)